MLPDASELPESGRFLAKPYRPAAIIQNIQEMLTE
jgi:hypothetical protein